MRIMVDKKIMNMPNGTTAGECLAAAGVPMAGVLAASRGTVIMELNDRIVADATLAPITLLDEEGRRIYERSLRFVMLLAVRQLWPGQTVRIEYSVGHGVFVRLVDRVMDSAMVAQLKERMLDITAQNLPFEKKSWSLNEAMRYFTEDGQPDKVALLHYRPFPYFNMYCCGGMWEYFYGAMTPSTGYVSVFDLVMHGTGFVLQLPTEQDQAHAAPYVDRPRILAAFAQSAKWCEILGVNNVADLDRLVEERGLRDFIRVNEVLHDQAMTDIAREVLASGKRIVLIAGPSSSGKTTFAGRIAVHLRGMGRRSVRISLDDYYRPRRLLARDKSNAVDLESIDALDVELFRDQIARLLRGEEVEVPRYNFKTRKRERKGTLMQLEPDTIVIIEGIHGLNPMLAEGLPPQQIHRIFVSALTCLNLDNHNRIRTTDVRLLRRVVRDYLFRGTAPNQTLDMWPSVREGEEKWVFPYQETADSVFNTALHYELPVLRHYAFHLLKQVSPDDSGYRLAIRLRKILNYIPDLDESVLEEIPPLSLLREFIGGCTIDEK